MNLVDKDKGLEATSQYDESDFPSSVNSFHNLTISIQVATAIPEIETQLRAYPDGIIGVLCPRHAELDVVCQVLSRSSLNENIQFQRHTDGYEAFDPERRVIVTTLHGAKGLEFRTVHLMGTDKIRNFLGQQRKMRFTGVTRAKTSLAIYHDRNLPGYLERGLAAIAPEVGTPKLEDYFSDGSE